MNDIRYIEGAEGPRGPKGDKGERGPLGLTGPKGEKGDRGERGPIGMEGPRGKRGPIGLDGKTGRPGRDGKDGKQGPKGEKGDKGEPGRDGQDADLSSVQNTIIQGFQTHEQKYDHSKIDPFLIGSKKLSEAGMSDGMFLQYDSKQDKVVYAKVKEAAKALRPYLYGRGLTLPSQEGNAGKFLTTDGVDISWGTPAGGGGGGTGITRSISSISSPATAGSTALTDYVYFVSGTTTLTLPTAVGNTNRYTVKNTGVATVTIATTSAQTIDGSASASLPVANTSLDLVSDGANWRVV